MPIRSGVIAHPAMSAYGTIHHRTRNNDEVDGNAVLLPVAVYQPIIEIDILGPKRCVAVQLEGQHLAQVLGGEQG